MIILILFKKIKLAINTAINTVALKGADLINIIKEENAK